MAIQEKEAEKETKSEETKQENITNSKPLNGKKKGKPGRKRRSNSACLSKKPLKKQRLPLATMRARSSSISKENNAKHVRNFYCEITVRNFHPQNNLFNLRYYSACKINFLYILLNLRFADKSCGP